MSNKGETPTMSEVMLEAIRAELLETHVSLPCSIETYDHETQMASIAPLLRKKYKSGEEVDVPVINNVPVQWPSGNGGASFIHMPLVKGDTGFAVFCERSLDRWLAGTGQTVTPNDPRHHDLSDAIFIPGVRPFQSAMAVPNNDSAFFAHGSMTIELDPSGKISITGNAKEFLTIVDNLLDELINNARVVTALGAQPFTAATITNLTAIKDDLAEIKRV